MGRCRDQQLGGARRDRLAIRRVCRAHSGRPLPPRRDLRSMKILMTADTIGGVWSYAMELCRSLSPMGIEVALATLGAPLSQTQRLEVARLTNVDVYESEYRLEWMASPW